MTLTAQTKIGLTFGQIFSLITTTALVVGFYYSLNLRITELESKNRQQDNELQAINHNMERFQKENREDHLKVSDKLDLLILNLSR